MNVYQSHELTKAYTETTSGNKQKSNLFNNKITLNTLKDNNRFTFYELIYISKRYITIC